MDVDVDKDEDRERSPVPTRLAWHPLTAATPLPLEHIHPTAPTSPTSSRTRTRTPGE